jgi:hypothetical protein
MMGAAYNFQMGAEVDCRATIDGVEREGRAYLETDHILFRGSDSRLKIPLVGLKVAAVDGRLEAGAATLHLGSNAAKWADKIQNPKSLLDKLGVKPGLNIAVINVRDETFLPAQRLKQNADLVFLGVETPDELGRLKAIRAKLAPAGAVWIIYPKGSKTIPEKDVMQATKAVGLVDVKVAAFSKTHTAIKAVIPKLERSALPPAKRAARR